MIASVPGAPPPPGEICPPTEVTLPVIESAPASVPPERVNVGAEIAAVPARDWPVEIVRGFVIASDPDVPLLAVSVPLPESVTSWTACARRWSR